MPTFDGRQATPDSVLAFAASAEDYLAASLQGENASSDLWPQGVGRLLRGEALDWYKAISNKERLTWRVFLDLLFAQFLGANQAQLLFAEISKASGNQGENESFATFSTKFERRVDMYERVSGHTLPDRVRVSYFKERLLNRYSRKVEMWESQRFGALDHSNQGVTPAQDPTLRDLIQGTQLLVAREKSKAPSAQVHLVTHNGSAGSKQPKPFKGAKGKKKPMKGQKAHQTPKAGCPFCDGHHKGGQCPIANARCGCCGQNRNHNLPGAPCTNTACVRCPKP